MANVTITIPDALIPRLSAAARANFPQHAALTDAQAFKAITAAYWRNILDSYEQSQAAEIASRNASTKAIADSAGIG